MKRIKGYDQKGEMGRLWRSRDKELEPCLIPINDVEIDPEREIIKDWMWATVDNAKLTKKELFILRMYLIVGWTFKEIADPLGVSKGYVGMLYAQTLDKLKQQALKLQ